MMEPIEKLEAEFRARQKDSAFLQRLLNELSFRATKRAAQLRADAERALLALAPAKPSMTPAPKPAATVVPFPTSSSKVPSPPPQPQVRPAQRATAAPITNQPDRILSAWTALEVLSPSSYVRPEDLAGGRRINVARLDAGPLPWEGAGQKSKRDHQLYYQLVLGSIDMNLALQQVMAIFSDTRPQRPSARGEAALAIVMLDRKGRPVNNAATVASFGWGVARVLGNDLRSLDRWPEAETSLTTQLDVRLRRVDADGQVLPLDAATIARCHDWLVGALGLPPGLVKPPAFAVRSYQFFKNPEPPQALLLNSFYLGDLATARKQFAAKTAPENLRRLLGVLPPPVRKDLLNDKASLADAVAPALFPAGRWPGPGRHPLVLLQQAAVNLAMNGLKQSGILAVNGPPGTGKTTLLRDVVAALVTERARAMAELDDPADAFVHSGQKLPAGNGWLHLYTVKPTLRGFEMVVASTNNKAVENVSAELPGLGSIAGDAGGLRYLKTVSDALHPQGSWGLIAAVLGNATNRSNFKQAFWWDDDSGLRRYLAAAAGVPQTIQVTDPATGQVVTRTPRIIVAERAPADHAAALARWRMARKAFRVCLTRSDASLQDFEQVHQAVKELPFLNQAVAVAGEGVKQAAHAAGQVALHDAAAERALAEGQDRLRAATEVWKAMSQGRPGFWARLFRRKHAIAWADAERSRHTAVQQASKETERLQASAKDAHRQAVQARQAHEAAIVRQRESGAVLQGATTRIEAARVAIGPGMIDPSHFKRSRHEQQMTAPWLNAATQAKRDDVFIAAMVLHKAFLDAAAKPLRHNLGALMQVFGGPSLPDDAKNALLPDLWTSLFLVVPVVSTTFASVERMFGSLPAEALGWLLIDEAGQAVPQAAVGAMMRTRRAVVVGDPVQVEPVVTLPNTLTHAICHDFGVDPDCFNAPEASVQTLADAATPFMAEFPGRDGSRTVGVPLLVHRRCAEPMFGISNAVAYENLMVQAKAPKASAIRDLLGPSAWFDVQGPSVGHWCPAEGQFVLSLLGRLVRAGVAPDLYIVTPFVAVQNGMRALVEGSGALPPGATDWAKWAHERVGTVHTVQGREAEAVIFVLGSPDPQQAGARGWAGKAPNLLNVAVTRSKEALYVVGSRGAWRGAGNFQVLDQRLPAG